MSVQKHNFRIGLFVLCGAALLVGALFAMGLKSYFGKRDIYETYLSGKVENLSVGALVMLRGVPIGKVSSIDFVGKEYPAFKEQYVTVQFKIPDDFSWTTEHNDVQAMLDTEIAHGLRARVQGQGFLGANIVSLEYVDPTLYPVEPIPWKPKHYYIPSAPSQFNHVFASLERTLRNVENVDVKDVLGRAQTLIDAADRLASNLNTVDFHQLGTNANSLVVEFRDTNHRLQGTLSDAHSTLSTAESAIRDADLARISTNTVALENKLGATAADLRRLLDHIDTAELNDSLANIRSATDESIGLLHTVAQRPSSVLFSKSPHPAPEVETPKKQ